jgi:alpha-tubulin suppressor-like RCC1 family protein
VLPRGWLAGGRAVALPAVVTSTLALSSTLGLCGPLAPPAALAGPGPAPQSLAAGTGSPATLKPAAGTLAVGTPAERSASYHGLSSALGLGRVRLIAAGAYSAYALSAGGQVWAWGDGIEGQLGNGASYTASALPVRVGDLSGVVGLAASYNSAYALRNGLVWSWGDDGQGQDGNGKAAYFEDRPQLVKGLAGVTMVAAGGYSAYALAAGGQLWAWGDNSSGQLALRLSVPGSDLPVRVGLREAGTLAGLAAGTSTAYALGRDGTVWAWGDNAFGELGRPQRLSASTSPLRVPGLGHVKALAANGFTALALVSNGTVWAWGDGSFGELGPTGCQGRRAAGLRVGGKGHLLPGRSRPTPGRPGAPATAAAPSWAQHNACRPWPKPRRVRGLARIKAIAAGGEAAYALGVDGAVWAWGDNAYGQLGNGTTQSSLRPVRVRGLRHVVALAAGGTSAYALEADGSVWAWGDNAYGQLGDGTTTASDLPVRARL